MIGGQTWLNGNAFLICSLFEQKGGGENNKGVVVLATFTLRVAFLSCEMGGRLGKIAWLSSSVSRCERWMGIVLGRALWHL